MAGSGSLLILQFASLRLNGDSTYPHITAVPDNLTFIPFLKGAWRILVCTSVVYTDSKLHESRITSPDRPAAIVGGTEGGPPHTA